MNYRLILKTLGMAILVEALALILPFACALIYHESRLWLFPLCILICAVVGGALRAVKPKHENMAFKEGMVIVALSWIVLSLLGALPFVISHVIPNYIDAVFETSSGFTTTGASIMKDVEHMPHSVQFWRCFTHWIGGMGVLVFMVAITPQNHSSRFNLMKAESTGPSVSKLVPRVGLSAKILYAIYTGLTVIMVILLLIGKMSLFDSLMTAFGTAGTGGFGVRNTSLGTFSPYIQVVVTVFMIMFGVDFAIYYCIILRKLRTVWSFTEVKTYLAVILVSIAIIFYCVRPLYPTAGEGLIHSAFQVGSIITTTGFSTANFDAWPQLAKTVLLVLMFIGACAGSTGGGIKVSRILILLKSMVKEFKLYIQPHSTRKIKLNGRIVEHETVRVVNVFFFAYILVFAVSLLIVSLDNFSFETNFSAVAATLNNIGPGFDAVGPTKNFSLYSPLSKIVLIFDMIAGRLEVLPMVLLFTPSIWRK